MVGQDGNQKGENSEEMKEDEDNEDIVYAAIRSAIVEYSNEADVDVIDETTRYIIDELKEAAVDLDISTEEGGLEDSISLADAEAHPFYSVFAPAATDLVGMEASKLGLAVAHIIDVYSTNASKRKQERRDEEARAVEATRKSNSQRRGLQGGECDLCERYMLLTEQ